MREREIREQVLPQVDPGEQEGGQGSADKRERFKLLRRSARGVGWLLASPAEWFGIKSIRAGASSISQTYGDIRKPRSRDRRFKTQDNRVFDMVGTAFAYGITIEELERRFAARRRQTALLAYGLFGLGCVLVLAWVCVAVRTVSDGGRVVLLLQFLPFLALFYLLSFYQALINFQIRMGRAASWLEYISAEKEFLPR
ncbi:hypothetical protein [Acidisoma silvae]|uniref:Uncharacterized protein n=1 Tax=Acidisoma silvae TaxID=2802396 RepID=A0A963YV51_9PROT|nr:hypothetical protein [Acidisoma silvae]MCB8877421.1 hypothetical protein [Acidisoma silvae]